MKNNTSKPHVLILRDFERAELLKKLLMNNDINVIVEPVYKIHPLKFKNINFIEYQALLVTSVNTIKILSEKVNIKQLKNIKTYCVGKVTEDHALKAGFNCIKTNAKSGITLAKNVIKQSQKNGKKVLLLGAEVLAYDPTKLFKESNLEFEKISIYKKIPFINLSKKCLHFLKNDNISNIVIYSPETARIFLSIAKNCTYENITVTCLGNKTIEILEKYKWKKIQVVNNTELKSFANKIIKSII